MTQTELQKVSNGCKNELAEVFSSSVLSLAAVSLQCSDATMALCNLNIILCVSLRVIDATAIEFSVDKKNHNVTKKLLKVITFLIHQTCTDDGSYDILLPIKMHITRG